MAKDSIRGIFFDIDKYDKSQLSIKSEQELYDTAMSDRGSTSIYTLDEISETVNFELMAFNSWLFFIDLNNVNANVK